MTALAKAPLRLQSRWETDLRKEGSSVVLQLDYVEGTISALVKPVVIRKTEF